MTMTRKDSIRSYVEKLSGDNLARLVQYMFDYDGSFEGFNYYDMSEFDELMSSHTPSEIAQMVHFGEFNPNKDYWRFDPYGNVKSLNWEEIVADAESIESDVINHLTNYYDGDTPWKDLDRLVDEEEDQ